MKEHIEIKDGVEYEVVLRGVAKTLSGRRFWLGAGPDISNLIDPDTEHVISVTKVEPPVVTFHPGQVVRNRQTGAICTIGSGGYIHHPTGFVHDGYREFTSADYELVEFK